MGDTGRVLLRHQLGSLLSGLVDFASMIAAVELLGASPTLGAAMGAALGGVTNFALGRRWIFNGASESPRVQALRYVVVSAASLSLNVAGEYLFTSVLHQQYVFARMGIALAVSLFWNFPMQRGFVFHHSTES
jgi:putative flippase GtrA